MSPRSDEFMQAARKRLTAAEAVIEQDPSAALSAAYYAMPYGARAALSERDTPTRTHRGTWHEFRKAFVEDGRIGADLATDVQRLQSEREQADYDAWAAPPAEAKQAIELAHRFLSAVEAVLD